MMRSGWRESGSRWRNVVGLLWRTVNYRTAAFLIVGIVTIVSVVAVPLKVTVDGVLYISSAKSLFKSDFATNYVWYREPGYPLFLKALHYLGNDGLFVVAAQAICLGLASFIALYAVRRMLRQTNVTVAQLVLTLLLTLNPMYLIYSALVLQQALFTLQLALFGLGVVWALRRPAWLRRSALLILVALNYFVAIWTSIGWLYLGLVPVTLTIVLCLWPETLRQLQKVTTLVWRSLAGFLLAVGIVALCALVYVVGLQVYSGWDVVKAPYLNNSSAPGAVIEPLSSVPYIPTVQEMTSRMFALMHMGTIKPYTQENDLFLRQQMLPDWAFSQWDTKFIAEPYTSYADGYFSLPNPSDELHNVFAKNSGWAPSLYSAAFVGFLLALALALVRREWGLLFILSVPLAFIAVYAASNSPIDRYGIPAYSWAVASVGVLFTWLGRLLLLTPLGGRLKSWFGVDAPARIAPSDL